MENNTAFCYNLLFFLKNVYKLTLRLIGIYRIKKKMDNNRYIKIYTNIGRSKGIKKLPTKLLLLVSSKYNQ